jgi:hypothetical protein
LRRLSERLPGSPLAQALVAGAVGAALAAAVLWDRVQRARRVAALRTGTILITGASQGIGAATARLLAKVRT